MLICRCECELSILEKNFLLIYVILFSERGRGKKPPPLDIMSAGDANGSGPKTPTNMSRHKSEKERKIGHRRVGVGGEITYKKVSI